MAFGFAVFLLDVVLAMYCAYQYGTTKRKHNIYFGLLYCVLAIFQGINLIYW